MNASFNLIFGLPDQGLSLHSEALSLFFGALLLPQMVASVLAGMRRSACFWLAFAGLALGFGAGSPFMLVFGVGLVGVAAGYMAAQTDIRQAASYARIIGFAVISLIVGLNLPGSPLGFLLTVLGALAFAGLMPFFGGLPRAYTLFPSPMSAFLSGGGVNMAFYILIRYGFVVAAGGQHPRWGAVLMAIGALLALVGALRAVLAVDLRNVLSWTTIAAAGLIIVGIGAALWANSMGYQEVSGLALQSVLLAILAHGLFKPLLFIGAGEVLQAVGTTSLNWLGGLMRGMPRLGMLMLLGATGVAMLPLGPAFAPVFLLIHATIEIALAGGALACLGCTALLVVIGVSVALLLLAGIKIIGFGFLGRPRSLQAAAAEDIRSAPFWGMVLLAGLCLPMALVPGFVMFFNAAVINTLIPSAPETELAYAPLTICLLAGLAFAVAGIVQTRKGSRGLRETPTWNGGFGYPPAWLPFGDPQTQPTASGLTEALLTNFSQTTKIVTRFSRFPILWKRLHKRCMRLIRSMENISPRLGLAIMFVVLVFSLLIFSLAQRG